MINPRLGILGGGQLARMLALSAHPLGIPVKIFANHSLDPAALVSSAVTVGALTDEAKLSQFATDLDFVTFESEFVDCATLARCLPTGVRVFPHLDVLAMIQDRLTQKQLLQRLKIPTSPWLPVQNAADLRLAAQKFPRGFVLKQRRFGYDGYGTFVYRDMKSLDLSPLQKSNYGFIAESFVEFKRELAVAFARTPSGRFLALPWVESVQQQSRCFSVHGPVRHASQSRVVALVKRLMQDLDYHGVLAVEMFDTGRGLLVNELAPRVHNSAHYSQDALACSQFEYHLRAGLDWPFPRVELLRPGFAMVNLLGTGQKEIQLSHAPHGRLHWYGKGENRTGRKLGHLNVLGKNPRAALRLALKWRKEFQL